MRAIYTDIISVRPCCPAVIRWNKQEASVSRFEYLDSVDELPVHPTPSEMTYGYIINGDIYVYVESGGDTLDGLYQNCGSFSGNLYTTTGQNEDGSMTQKAATDALSVKLDAGNFDRIMTPLTDSETISLLNL